MQGHEADDAAHRRRMSDELAKLEARTRREAANRTDAVAQQAEANGDTRRLLTPARSPCCTVAVSAPPCPDAARRRTSCSYGHAAARGSAPSPHSAAPSLTRP